MQLRHWIVALVIILALAPLAAAADFVLVVNKSNPQPPLSENEVKNIFLGKMTVWNNGAAIAMVTQENPDVHEFFVRNVVNKTGQQYATYWKKALFTGTGTPPPVLKNDAEVRAFVAANIGGIGYVSASSIDASVRVLAFK
ncbi:MAG: substrate-binding domain-containing protein [Desulfuromonadales bacterium]|nr:substrate-binding domain-containing protein [Desulfuromonadales bacterium]